jgi:hypothetical protein
MFILREVSRTFLLLEEHVESMSTTKNAHFMHFFEYVFGHDESNPHFFSVIHVLIERSGSQYTEPQTNFKPPLGYCTTSDYVVEVGCSERPARDFLGIRHLEHTWQPD